MGLADLIIDGAAATLINRVQGELNNYNEDTLEHAAHLEMLGNFNTRVTNAAEDYIKTYGDELAQSVKDAAIKLGRDSAGALGKFAQKNLNFEDKINSTLSDILDYGSFDSITSVFDKKNAGQVKEPLGTVHSEPIAENKINQLIGVQNSAKNNTVIKMPSSEDYPRLIHFLRALGSNDPLYKLMHKYYFMVTITFKTLTGKTDLERQLKVFQPTAASKSLQILTRRVEIPHIQSEHTNLKNEFGHMALPGKTTIPSENSLIVGYLSTEYSIHESIMVEWLKQTTSDEYQYFERPFMKAEIDIDFFDQGFKNKLLTYRFMDCFPQNIALLDPNYNDTSLNPRDVRFSFDYMKIIRHNDPTGIDTIASNSPSIPTYGIPSAGGGIMQS